MSLARMRARTWIAMALGAALFAPACGRDVRRTQVIVTIDADPSVREQTTQLEIVVFGGSEAIPTAREDFDLADIESRDWPRTFALAPRERDASRNYRLEIRALGPAGEAVTSTRVISGFIEERTLWLKVRLVDACIGVDPCADLERTCARGASCDSTSVVDATSLEDFPTGGLDGGADASTLDAGPVDANPLLCAANQHVVANACAPCPAGSTNAAGDDAAGPDTACDPTRCGADQRVLANTCVLCPAGLTNAPGDDATGPDTTCDDACSVVFGVTCDRFEEGYLKASNTDMSDHFGVSVALSGDTLAIGAPLEDSAATGVGGNQDSDATLDSGAVYVFVRTGTTWAQQAYLKASNTGSFDDFGFSVALSGDTLAVGAPLDDSAATGVGGDQTSNAATNSGAVYVFVRTGTTWTQQAYLKASNTGASDLFGSSLALTGDTLAVAAPAEDSAATGVGGDQTSNAAMDSGAVYVFVRTGTTWTQQAYLKASNTGAGDNFGSSLALSGDTLAIGAEREDSHATGVGGDQTSNAARDTGAVYVFVRTGTAWSQQAYVKASNTGADDLFGSSLALSGDTLAIGAPLEDSAATGVGGDQASHAALDSGAVYVFVRTGTTWTQQAYLKASNTGSFDNFGWSVALSGDTLAIGAPFEDSAAIGMAGDQASNAATNSGAVYVFVRAGTTWIQQAYVKASNTGGEDELGWSVALSADTLVIGARLEDSAATGVDGDQTSDDATNSGAVYVRRIAP